VSDGTAGTPVDVALVVVTYNSAPLLPAFVDSLADGLRDAGRWRVVVVDNGSTDGTLERLATLMPDAGRVQMGWNAGYAAAINMGVRLSRPARNYLVLNPDIRLDPYAVARMLECLRSPGTGQVVPVIRTGEDMLITSLRREPTVRRALGEAILGGRRAGRFASLGEIVVDRDAYRAGRTADWATGAAVLFSEHCREAVGEWDESFFLYSEETDFSLRARDAGLLLRLQPSATAVHLRGDQHAAPELYGLALVNRIRLYRRRHGTPAAAAYWAAVVLGEVMRVLAGKRLHRVALRALFRKPAATVAGARGPQPAAPVPVVLCAGTVIDA
jgi:GT2 family glycosyltransferase